MTDYCSRACHDIWRGLKGAGDRKWGNGYLRRRCSSRLCLRRRWSEWSIQAARSTPAPSRSRSRSRNHPRETLGKIKRFGSAWDGLATCSVPNAKSLAPRAAACAAWIAKTDRTDPLAGNRRNRAMTDGGSATSGRLPAPVAHLRAQIRIIWDVRASSLIWREAKKLGSHP